jgi:hypothetical protein
LPARSAQAAAQSIQGHTQQRTFWTIEQDFGNDLRGYRAKQDDIFDARHVIANGPWIPGQFQLQ